MGPERPPALLLNLLLQFHIELGQVDVQLQDERRQIVSVVLEQQLKNENVVYTNCIYIQYNGMQSLKKDILSHVTTWINLGDIMLNKIS